MSLHYYSYATNSPEHISYVQTQVKACNYKYILDWTDDDRRLPSSLLSQVQRLEQNQAAVFCCGPAQQIDHNGDQIDGAIYRGGGLGEVLTFKNFVVTCPIVMGSVLWKAEHYDPTVKQPSRIGGEWPKYIKALSKHGSYAINLPQVLTQLRIHDKSDTEVNGFRKNEFVEMHMGMWKQLVEDYHYQPTMQQWDEMTNIILGLLARKYDPFSGEPFPGPGFEEFRAFRSKYGVNK
jgi:hypothetical protein